MSFENPYLPDNFKEILEGLPEHHPAREKQMFTTIQSFAYPVLLWLCDTHRNLGQGRSTLCAFVAIELAMRGEKVFLNDISTMLLFGDNYRMKQVFAENVMKLCNMYFKEHLFQYKKATNELIYQGRRPK